MRSILFVAGEPSGDLHAAGVAMELKGDGDLRLRGVGGDLMQAAGVKLDHHIRDLAVLGFVEILKHVPRHWRMLREIRKLLRSGEVSLVVLVDYPGFNMRVAEAAKQAGVPVLYYIVPQVWAWGADRLARMREWLTRAAVILPFEEKLLRDHGIDATFVGHPLLDRAGVLPDRVTARRTLGVDPDRPLLALFPGSRAQEIDRHIDAFVETARILEGRVPGLSIIVSAAPNIEIDPARCPYPIVSSASMSVLRAADAAMCKSGTTTLEAAVAGCPMVVAYRTHALTYAAARRLVKIPHIALVNVVAGREVVPEFIQERLVPGRVAVVLEKLLRPDDEVRAQMLGGLAEVRRKLGTPGAARRVAGIVRGLAAQG